ncbi:MAG: hypothetical protein E7316_02655 [Clostridiales bacterium]|nr:hypothetical protein [Clostridiales bacterium]
MKKWLALLMTLCMMIPAALAEEVSLAEILPLADAAAAAAMEETERYCGVRPMAVDASEAGDAVRILGDVYLAADQLEKLSDEQYEQAEWLDQRAVVEMRRAADGWEVTFFSLDAEWEMEDAAQEYFATTMVEYVNAEMGFSIQYPAVFGPDSVTELENGVSGQAEGASFSVTCVPNEENWTTETLLANQKKETFEAETNIDTITGMGTLRVSGAEQTMVRMLIVTPTHIYQAELVYDQSLMRDFTTYCDYMINSFTVDELGLG